MEAGSQEPVASTQMQFNSYTPSGLIFSLLRNPNAEISMGSSELEVADKKLGECNPCDAQIFSPPRVLGRRTQAREKKTWPETRCW